ncbi:heavy metal-associated isoprenylated plant protein 7-like isoform X2 [Lycium barbarum]|uniref:heavy metal-associated isoprenylated plant protein 7-like isoform X2 n=1 Tax=Lycium barbarum TaxID=112863 RepID=UPI00293E7F39|nr:heavy metal-associated isoprenylated plant protein 7-like isoform X2 [Lycium barbarum]
MSLLKKETGRAFHSLCSLKFKSCLELFDYMAEEKENKGEEDKKEEEQKVEEKKEEKKEDEVQEIVLKVDMHCEACARKVARALKGFQGVEEVTADSKASKVVVKGKNADPLKVCERIQKKSGRKVQLISPLPKPPEENKKDEKKEELPKEEKKDEPPPVITVKMTVQMHCDACAQVIQKRIRKIKGVESVTTDLENNQVIVKGVVDPEKLANDVHKRTGKQAIVVKEEEVKKEEEKKEEEKREKEEEKKGNEEEGKGKEEDDKTTTDIKKSEYMHQKDYIFMEYANYPSQIFSDENPHACSVM